MPSLQDVVYRLCQAGADRAGEIVLYPQDAVRFVGALEHLQIPLHGVCGLRTIRGGSDRELPYGFIDSGDPPSASADAARARSLIAGFVEQGVDALAVHFDYRDMAEPLIRRFRPLLDEAAASIRAEFPVTDVAVRSYSVGGRTQLQGWSLGIDCGLPNVPEDEADNVALSISFKHIPTDPLVGSVDVVWGHPSGYIEGEMQLDDVLVTGSVLAQIESELPDLVVALSKALQRGRPPA